MFKIQIPKPCHANWNEMTPTEQGAFCSSCSKEVVDFTRMTDEEVQNYFLHKSNGKTCGHFRAEQLHRIRISLPENILIQKIAGWKKFMAVLMLAFGSMLFGCDVGIDKTTNNKTEVQHSEIHLAGDTSFTKGTPAVTDVPPPDVPPLLGAAIPFFDTLKACNKLTGDTVFTVDGQVETDSIGTIDNKTDSINSFNNQILLGEPSVVEVKKFTDTVNKKSVADTGKCNDTGYY